MTIESSGWGANVCGADTRPDGVLKKCARERDERMETLLRAVNGRSSYGVVAIAEQATKTLVR